MSKIAITIDGEYLELFDNNSITVELNNPAVTRNANSIIPGSFSLPFRIPFRGANKTILKNCNLISAEGIPFKEPNEAIIIIDGIPLVSGRAYLSNATESGANIYIVSNKTHELKDTSIREVDLGGQRDIDDPDPITHAKGTAENPDDHDYIFFPVRNTSFFSEVNTDEYTPPDPNGFVGWYQNLWDVVTQAFVDDTDQQIAMPFVKLSYILSQVILHAGFHLDNQFNSEGEFKDLCLYNNYSIYEGDSWSESLNLSNHLPEIKCTELIKEVTALFALGFFPGLLNNKITLKPIRDVLLSSPELDWTGKAHHTHKIVFNTEEISSFGYDTDEIFLTGTTSASNGQFIPSEFTVVQRVTNLTGQPPGYYYVNSGNYFIEIRPDYPNGDPRPRGFLGYPLLSADFETTKGGVFRSKLVPVHSASALATGVHAENWLVPQIRQPGAHADFEIDAASPLRLLCYRGMQEDSEGRLYPMASPHYFDINEDTIGSKSLLWNKFLGNGLYWQHWFEWQYILQNEKRITRKFNLTMADLLNFSFDKLIYCENQTYMATSIKLNITDAGIGATDVTLIRIPGSPDPPVPV